MKDEEIVRYKGTITVEAGTEIYNALNKLFDNREMGETLNYNSNSGLLKIKFCVMSVRYLKNGNVEFEIESI